MWEKSDSITVPFRETSNMCETDQITTKYPPILLNRYLENQRIFILHENIKISFVFFSFLSQKWSFFWLFNSSISLPTYFLCEEFFVIKFRRRSSSNEEMQPLVIIHNHCEFFLDEEVLQNKIIRFLGKNYN